MEHRLLLIPEKKHDNSGTSNGKLHFRFGHLSGWCFRVPGSVCWWTGAWKDHTGNQGNTKGESLVTSLGSCLGHHIRRCSCVKAHRTSHMKRFGWGVVNFFDPFLFLCVFYYMKRLTQPFYAWLLANLAWYSAIDVLLWIQTIWHHCICTWRCLPYIHMSSMSAWPARRAGGRLAWSLVWPVSCCKKGFCWTLATCSWEWDWGKHLKPSTMTHW